LEYALRSLIGVSLSNDTSTFTSSSPNVMFPASAAERELVRQREGRSVEPLLRGMLEHRR
jgi:hypothetical protein